MPINTNIAPRLWISVTLAILGAGGLAALAIVDGWPRAAALQIAGIWLAIILLFLLFLSGRRNEQLSRRLQRKFKQLSMDHAKLAARFETQPAKLLQTCLAEQKKELAPIDAGQAKLLVRLNNANGKLNDVSMKLNDVSQTLHHVREEELPKLERSLIESQERSSRAAGKNIAMQGYRDYEQQVAWHQLHDILRPDHYMPALRRWAASPDCLCLLVEAIRERRPTLAVECGSGASSVWLGLALRRFGGGRLVSIEHDKQYADTVRELVAAFDLSDLVEVRHAPLRDWTPDDGGTSQPWYDTDSISDLFDIDLLFVDGPPGKTAPNGRYPAGPVLLPRCSATCVVVLDDAARTDELAISNRWLEAFPDFSRSVVDTEKGTHVFVRGGSLKKRQLSVLSTWKEQPAATSEPARKNHLLLPSKLPARPVGAGHTGPRSTRPRSDAITPIGNASTNRKTYWGKRQGLMYYEYIYQLVSAFAQNADSIIDVGSANAGYLEWFDWIPRRETLDIKKPYNSGTVKGIKADFFSFTPEVKYDFATCLQVLEHIPDAKAFTEKLLSVASNVLISVPYRWKKGSCKWHIHDPVDMEKLVSWTSRKPDYHVIVTEPLNISRNAKRLIAYFHDPSEAFDLKQIRTDIQHYRPRRMG
jgi:predicted O-methyltransferase YrrM